MAHVFISYEKTDRAVAETICQYLEENGIECWIAPRNVLPGREWDVSIIEAIKTAGCMVLVFSSRADASRQVKREITIADNNNVPIIPCRIKNVEPSNLAYFLTLSHWFDAFEYPLEHHLPQLLTTITSHMPDLQVKASFSELRPAESEHSMPPSKVEVEAPPEKEAPPAKQFTNSLGMTFVLIPAGNFMMGSPEDELGRKKDERQHQVTISRPFYLQTAPVTQGQWEKVMNNNPSKFKGCGENCPVEQVSWNDAQEFIKNLNRKEKTDKYRLPTEAEWEYACRAGSTGKWCFGDDKAKLGEYAWYEANSGQKTHPVGQKKPNAWGLYDMHGNVWEWCQDWYGDYPPGPLTDPKGGPEPGFWKKLTLRGRVLRGGSWYYFARSSRSAFRYYRGPGLRYDFIGFRVARAL